MWVMTKVGFFSAVYDDAEDKLVLRARVGADLDDLREQYLPDLSPSWIDIEGIRDYPYRAWCTAEQWGAALAKLAVDIDYTNFKSEVAESQGKDRAHIYGDVWYDLLKLEKLNPQLEFDFEPYEMLDDSMFVRRDDEEYIALQQWFRDHMNVKEEDREAA